MTSPSRSVCIGVMFFVFAMVGTACTHYEPSDRQMTFNDALQDAEEPLSQDIERGGGVDPDAQDI